MPLPESSRSFPLSAARSIRKLAVPEFQVAFEFQRQLNARIFGQSLPRIGLTAPTCRIPADHRSEPQRR
jgi:hypothetical protein